MQFSAIIFKDILSSIINAMLDAQNGMMMIQLLEIMSSNSS